jgi:hypothetical protein
MSDVLSLLRKRGAGEHREDTESRQHDLPIGQIHFASPHRVAPCHFSTRDSALHKDSSVTFESRFFYANSSPQMEYLGMRDLFM